MFKTTSGLFVVQATDGSSVLALALNLALHERILAHSTQQIKSSRTGLMHDLATITGLLVKHQQQGGLRRFIGLQ